MIRVEEIIIEDFYRYEYGKNNDIADGIVFADTINNAKIKPIISFLRLIF
jgi:hypothetical protein